MASLAERWGRRAASVAMGSAVAAGAAGCGPAPDRAGEDWGQVESAQVVCAQGEQLEGIDVSYYQGSPNWSAVAGTGLAFAIARVNHGGFMDPEFDTNWTAIRNEGLVRGAYQYFNPGDDPAAQATTLIDKVGTLGPGDMPAVLDVESTDGLGPANIAAHVTTWVDLVEGATGRTPIIYTGSYFWNDNVGSTAQADHPLWIAHYTQSCPNLPDAWSDWQMWQYSSTGAVAGISGNVDLDRFNGSALALQDFAANGYRASVVSVDYPSSLAVGQSAAVELVVRNEGARGWDSATKLGTTVPRDRPSPFAASDWENDHRAAAVGAATASGDTTTLSFTITAPLEPGQYTEHFNLLQESVAWFSDTPPGGGPADEEIALSITVVPGDGTGGLGGGGASNASGGSGGSAPRGIPNTGLHGSCAVASASVGHGASHHGLGWIALALMPVLRRRRRGRRARQRAGG